MAHYTASPAAPVITASLISDACDLVQQLGRPQQNIQEVEHRPFAGRVAFGGQTDRALFEMGVVEPKDDLTVDQEIVVRSGSDNLQRVEPIGYARD